VDNKSYRIKDTVMSGRVKLHLFHPSERKIFTVVGVDNEYWADLDISFCSCKNYYYKTMSTGEWCYHLNSVALSLVQRKFQMIEFNDCEYSGFINALINDSIKLLTV
jgi:predicted nucleic acid-binding Zn finger protein